MNATSTIPFLLQNPHDLVQRVFGSVGVKDRRRVRRLLRVALGCLCFPGKTLREMFPRPAESKGGYRLVENKKVSVKALFQALTRAGAEACRGHRLVYLVGDSTDLVFLHRRPIQGLGPINGADDTQQALLVHTYLILDERFCPLGVLSVQRWVRKAETIGQRDRRRQRAFEKKESARWVKGMKECVTLLREVLGADGPRVVFVTDRESDIYEVFEAAQTLPAGLLVRAAQNRRVEEEAGYVWEEVESRPAKRRFTLNVPARAGQKERQAELEVRQARVTLKPPRRCRKGKPPIRLWALQARETKPPKNQTGLEWMLLSTEPLSGGRERPRGVVMYSGRWRVEDLHLILKSGCRIEKVRFETRENLERWLALNLLTALRILALRHYGRTAPETPVRRVLEKRERQALQSFARYLDGPLVRIQTVAEAMHYIARLGGYVKWKQDNRPCGVRILWRGLQALQLLALGYQLAHPQPP